jgi:hypothetical protein
LDRFLFVSHRIEDKKLESSMVSIKKEKTIRRISLKITEANPGWYDLKVNGVTEAPERARREVLKYWKECLAQP